MGFQADKEVEPLDYDFAPHAEVRGIINEPSTKQVNAFREAVVAALQGSGLDPELLKDGQVTLSDLSQLGELMKKNSAVEDQITIEVGKLTGINQTVLKALPFRVKTAFTGWIMGLFFNPEA